MWWWGAMGRHPRLPAWGNNFPASILLSKVSVIIPVVYVSYYMDPAELVISSVGFENFAYPNENNFY